MAGTCLPAGRRPVIQTPDWYGYKYKIQTFDHKESNFLQKVAAENSELEKEE